MHALMILKANLIAEKEELDIAGREARGSCGVGNKMVLGFVFAACAFEFGTFFTVDGKVAVSVAI